MQLERKESEEEDSKTGVGRKQEKGKSIIGLPLWAAPNCLALFSMRKKKGRNSWTE